VLLLERHEEREVVEPLGMLRPEGLELGARLGRRLGLEALRRTREAVELEADDRSVVDALVVERHAGEVARVQPTGALEPLERDQVGVAGEGGEALVRAVAVAGGAERHHLPGALPRLGQEVDPALGVRAELTDAEGAGERGRVEQDAGAAG